MKDAESSKASMTTGEAEKLQALFVQQQEELECKLAAADKVPQDNLRSHFSELDASLQKLQRLYSSSSPYLRIYYRKIYQDALQTLQAKIQEAEVRLLPPKKFVFKGNRIKNQSKPATKKIQQSVKKDKIEDHVDRANSCVHRDLINTDITLLASDVSGKDVLLSNVKNCKIQILGSPITVHLANVVESSVRCGPVSTSVFVVNAKCCQLELACQQLRIHETTDTDFYIHVTSKAIIEECRNVRFGTYQFTYETLEQDYLASGLPREINNWRLIDDFNWLVAGQPSPNWSLIEPC